MSKLLYTREIEDELMIQFIIMYALMGADEPLAYADLVSVVQDNCEINFNDLQLGLDNLVKTGHVSVKCPNDMLSIYDLTQKGRYVIDFFYTQIPLIIREPIDKSIKSLYLEKRRSEAVRSWIDPINEKEFNTECSLYNDDKLMLMSLRLYAGSRDEAERVAEHFKKHSAQIYGGILNFFDENSFEEKTSDKENN